MPDEQAPTAETPQTPVFDGLASAPSEPTPEPTPEASVPSETAQPVSEAAPEAVAAEQQSEPADVPEVEVETPRQPATSAVQTAPPSPAANTSPQAARELLVKARAKIQTKKQQKLETIMTLFNAKEKITNDDVEKLLHCSDATARRYLKELVKQGKLNRVGETGAGVVYVKA